MSRLVNYPWPGNIRELQNVIERAVVLSQGHTLELAAGFGPQVEPATVSESRFTSQRSGNSGDSVAAASTPNDASLTEVERRHIESVLTQTNWMIEGERGAAKVLNLSPSTLRSRMQKFGHPAAGSVFLNRRNCTPRVRLPINSFCSLQLFRHKWRTIRQFDSSCSDLAEQRDAGGIQE